MKHFLLGSKRVRIKLEKLSVPKEKRLLDPKLCCLAFEMPKSHTGVCVCVFTWYMHDLVICIKTFNSCPSTNLLTFKLEGRADFWKCLQMRHYVTSKCKTIVENDI